LGSDLFTRHLQLLALSANSYFCQSPEIQRGCGRVSAAFGGQRRPVQRIETVGRELQHGFILDERLPGLFLLEQLSDQASRLSTRTRSKQLAYKLLQERRTGA
jgi:hypothetical protein